MTGGRLIRLIPGGEEERLRYERAGDGSMIADTAIRTERMWKAYGWTVHPDPEPLPTEPGSCGWATVDGGRHPVWLVEDSHSTWVTYTAGGDYHWVAPQDLSDFRPVVFPADPLTAEQEPVEKEQPEAAPRYVADGTYVYDVQGGKRAPFVTALRANQVAEKWNAGTGYPDGFDWEPVL